MSVNQSNRLDDSAPVGELETHLAALWGQLLGHATIGRHDRFLSLGGDSLLAGQLVTQVSEAYGIDLSLSEFFDSPTIAGQAAAVARQLLDAAANSPAEAQYDSGSF